MSVAKKALLIVGAPFTLAAVLGGAAAFASQTGGHESHDAHSGYHRISFHEGTAADGTDCPNHSGASTTDAAVSPSVY